MFMFCIFGWLFFLLTGCSNKKPAEKASKRVASDNLSKVESNPKLEKPPKNPSEKKKTSEKPKTERKKSSEKKVKEESKKNVVIPAEDANKNEAQPKSEKIDIASLMLKKMADETIPKTDLESDKEESAGEPGAHAVPDARKTPKKKEKAEPSDYAFN